jgi:hypothetical protein
VNWNIKLAFITPLFSHGATDEPEIRPASVRGMLHHWFRLVGGDIEQERSVFGGNANKESGCQAAAGKVVVRVSDIQARQGSQNTLPHKTGGAASPRSAFLAGTACTLRVFGRLGGLSGGEEALFRDAVYAWLLMGTLGYRSTRAAGSFVWESEDFPVPTPENYQKAMDRLAAKGKFKAALLPKEFADPGTPRSLVSNSLKMTEHNRPLGNIVYWTDGEKIPRKTSPLKYRLVRFGTRFQLVAVWDCRQAVTGNSPEDLHAVVKAFLRGVGNPPSTELGELLAASALTQLP